MSERPPGPLFSEELYRWLLLIYPRRFRGSYGSDAAVELFRDQYREAHTRRCMLGIVVLWARTLPNVGWHGVLEGLSNVRDVMRGLREAIVTGALRSVLRSD